MIWFSISGCCCYSVAFSFPLTALHGGACCLLLFFFCSRELPLVLNGACEPEPGVHPVGSMAALAHGVATNCSFLPGAFVYLYFFLLDF